MYILGMVILVFFAIIGLAVFIGTIVRANLISDTDGLVLLIPSVDENNAEARIRSAGLLTQNVRGYRIVCVCSEDAPARKICEKMKTENPRLEIVEEYNVISR